MFRLDSTQRIGPLPPPQGAPKRKPTLPYKDLDASQIITKLKPPRENRNDVKAPVNNQMAQLARYYNRDNARRVEGRGSVFESIKIKHHTTEELIRKYLEDQQKKNGNVAPPLTSADALVSQGVNTDWLQGMEIDTQTDPILREIILQRTMGAQTGGSLRGSPRSTYSPTASSVYSAASGASSTGPRPPSILYGRHLVNALLDTASGLGSDIGAVGGGVGAAMGSGIRAVGSGIGTVLGAGIGTVGSGAEAATGALYGAASELRASLNAALEASAARGREAKNALAQTLQSARAQEAQDAATFASHYSTAAVPRLRKRGSPVPRAQEAPENTNDVAPQAPGNTNMILPLYQQTFAPLQPQEHAVAIPLAVRQQAADAVAAVMAGAGGPAPPQPEPADVIEVKDEEERDVDEEEEVEEEEVAEEEPIAKAEYERLMKEYAKRGGRSDIDSLTNELAVYGWRPVAGSNRVKKERVAHLLAKLKSGLAITAEDVKRRDRDGGFQQLTPVEPVSSRTRSKTSKL